jgi:hypothetical protein
LRRTLIFFAFHSQLENREGGLVLAAYFVDFSVLESAGGGRYFYNAAAG